MAACLILCSTLAVSQGEQREMTVTLGPETVFPGPVEDLFSLLSGALATGRNGRVGNEFVFWEFTLPDARAVNLFACAERPEVDCRQRRFAVCPGPFDSLAESIIGGQLRSLDCAAVGVLGIGDLRAGCNDNTREESVFAGVLACR